MSKVKQLLTAVERGDAAAADRLLPTIYEELRRLAAHQLALEPPGQTLQATALVHEAYLRLVGNADRQWNGAHHFFSAAAEVIRHILIDNARRKKRLKHGGQLERVNVDEVALASPLPEDQLLAVDAALDRFATLDPRAAEVVKLRFFAGLTGAQIAAQLGVSQATVDRIWVFARAWLFNEIQQDLGIASDVRETGAEKRG
jgi:RNA polymerase sigma factor (TIGR02999 family)